VIIVECLLSKEKHQIPNHKNQNKLQEPGIKNPAAEIAKKHLTDQVVKFVILWSFIIEILNLFGSWGL